MRFLVDECTGPAVARWLRQQNHDVFSVYEQARGSRQLLQPWKEGRTLVVRPSSFVEFVEPAAYVFGVGVFDGFKNGRNLASVPSLPGGKQSRRRPPRYSLAKGRLGREREVKVLYF